MTTDQILELIEGRLICRGHEHDIVYGFASDLMSDVLALCDEKVVLLTGLANLQTIRTAEMSGIDHIIFVRDKKVTPAMKKIAIENEMTLIETSWSMFRSCAKLYNSDLKHCF